MKYKLLMLVMIFLFFPLSTALYSGDCLPVDLSELESLDNVVYDVVGNESNLEGLTIELNSTIANICTVQNYKPDSFTVIFIDNSTKEIVKEIHHYSSGGDSSRTIYEDRNITTYVDRIVYKEKDGTGKIKLTPKEKPLLLLLLLIVASFLSLLFLIRMILNMKHKHT